MTKRYVGVKEVDAWPQDRDGKRGYAVKYEDGYISWSPADVFERFYFPIRQDDPTRLDEQTIERMVFGGIHTKFANKTTATTLQLRNGHEVVGTSSAMDPENYDHEIGSRISRGRALDKVGELLAFVISWGRNGLLPQPTDDEG